jgi:hypothetical protein
VKYLALAATFFLSIPLIALQAVSESRFRAQTDFLKLPPNIYFGRSCRSSCQFQGHIFVFYRGNARGAQHSI